MRTQLSKSAKFHHITGEASETPTLSVGVALLRGRARPSLDNGHCQWPTCFLWASQPRKTETMHIIWLILKILIVFFVLKLVLVQLNNWVFTIWRKPQIWIISVTILGFLFVIGLSRLADAKNVIAWAGIMGFFSMFPPSLKSKAAQQEANRLMDEEYAEMGMPNGRRLYWTGIFLFLVGMVIGWVLSFGEIYTPAS